MLGYQDSAHLRKLTKEDKKRINDMQKLHDFEVTNFDFLPELPEDTAIRF